MSIDRLVFTVESRRSCFLPVHHTRRHPVQEQIQRLTEEARAAASSAADVDGLDAIRGFQREQLAVLAQ